MENMEKPKFKFLTGPMVFALIANAVNLAGIFLPSVIAEYDSYYEEFTEVNRIAAEMGRGSLVPQVAPAVYQWQYIGVAAMVIAGIILLATLDRGTDGVRAMMLIEGGLKLYILNISRRMVVTNVEEMSGELAHYGIGHFMMLLSMLLLVVATIPLSGERKERDYAIKQWKAQVKEQKKAAKAAAKEAAKQAKNSDEQSI